MTTLRMDWATSKALAFACKHWHYSGIVPSGKVVRIGVWEDDRFVGVVCFSLGATGKLGTRYGLTGLQVCELARIAMTTHVTPVSRIVAIALRMLKRLCPGTRLVVSFADPLAGHHGGIYQAGGWIYAGLTAKVSEFRDAHGNRIPRRAYVGSCFGQPRRPLPPGAYKVPIPGKHRYLMPLDETMRRELQSFSQPYPRACESSRRPVPPALGGADSDPHAPSQGADA